MKEFWPYCVQLLSQKLPVEQIKAWIEPLVLHHYDAESGELHIVAPNPTKQKWVRNQYIVDIQKIASDWYKNDELKVFIDLPNKKKTLPVKKRSDSTPEAKSQANSALRIIIEDEDDHVELGQDETLISIDLAPSSSQAKQVGRTNGANSHVQVQVAPHKYNDQSHLNPEQTFDTLVVGKSNEFPAMAARNIAEHPGGPGYGHNPFYIYGSTGLGKTHIMHAIGNAILSGMPTLKVRYIHANQYYTDMSQAYVKSSFDAWRQDYETMDVLLIDDIQFLKTKTSTKEQFFHLFERMISQNKQIVIASDTYPSKLEDMSARLTSRFNSGLTLAVEPPELEMREEILRQKLKSRPGMVLTEDAVRFLATHVRSNVRELEGALTKVMAFATFHSVNELTIDVCRQALSDLLSATAGRVTVENIQKIVAEMFKIKVSDMYSKRRHSAIAKPRQIAMYLSKELTGKSFPAIGELFGGRDHTTILHACKKISSERLQDDELNHQLHVLEQNLKG